MEKNVGKCKLWQKAIIMQCLKHLENTTCENWTNNGGTDSQIGTLKFVLENFEKQRLKAYYYRGSNKNIISPIWHLIRWHVGVWMEEERHVRCHENRTNTIWKNSLKILKSWKCMVLICIMREKQSEKNTK